VHPPLVILCWVKVHHLWSYCVGLKCIHLWSYCVGLKCILLWSYCVGLKVHPPLVILCWVKSQKPFVVIPSLPHSLFPHEGQFMIHAATVERPTRGGQYNRYGNTSQ
jgi:hypothetical protein